MAIRKFRKNMKPVIWVVTIFFLISLVAGYAMSFQGHSAATNSQIAFKLNGEKVTQMETQRTMAILSENYNRYLGFTVNPEVMNVIGFNEVINKELTLKMAKELKLKISSSEIDEQIDKIKANFKTTKEFKRAIMAQGYTTKTLENEIRESLLIQKVISEINDNIKVTPTEIEKYYNEYKYTMYNGKSLNDVKGQIETTLKTQKGSEKYAIDLAKAKENMKITDVSQNYKEYLEKKEFVIEGVTVTNLDYAKKILGSIIANKGDLEKSKVEAKKSLTSEIALLKEAETKGVIVKKYLPLDMEINEAIQGLYSKLKSQVKYTDKDLETYFTENKMQYDTPKSAVADIAVFKVLPSKEDDTKAKAKAEKILKEVTPSNFAKMAKEYSDGPSAPTGGALGEFAKGAMVKPFEEAAFSGKVGEIYPTVVKTQFGYHIIYVESKDEKTEKVKASHILIIPEPSKATLTAKQGEVKEMISDLSNGTITFKDLKNDKNIVFSEKVSNINTSGYISGLGYNDILTKAIFNSKIDKVDFIEDKNDYLIYKKDSQIEAKEAQFKDVKGQVTSEYINSKAQEQLKAIELKIENKVK
ncbi:peptidylprolyl isomerase [uncultured Cetobacterium sp.]|uniref:peptidylprolyl isomerase n=2 Tax=uncultured Cetobacterium sp. TaxID=527638 RepID=UPI00260677F7|nr:peptidylprolyl isomerase [uncultured Cetobacterium sp.]